MRRFWTSLRWSDALLAALLVGMAVGLPALTSRRSWSVHPQTGSVGAMELPVEDLREQLGHKLPPGRPAVREASGEWLDLDWGHLPHHGVSSRQPIHIHVAEHDVVNGDIWNCFQSVSHACNGDRDSNIFHTWPEVDLYVARLDEAATWRTIEGSLKKGDVVGFWIYESIRGSKWTPTETHVQICTGEGGRMWAANNEPRFPVVKGVPQQTGMWWECTAWEYFQAMKGSDAYWREMGYERYYFVKVYHCPWEKSKMEVAGHPVRGSGG